MPKSLPKIIASILLGMVFLLGGAGVASAAGYTYTYFAKSAPSSMLTSQTFQSQSECDASLMSLPIAQYGIQSGCSLATPTTVAGANSSGAAAAVGGGAGVASAQGTTSSAGYYFLFITNPGSTNISVGVSNKYSNFSSCMSDQKVATGTSGAQLAVNCSYYSSDGAAIAKASIMGSAAKKNIEKNSGPTELKGFACGGLAFEVKGCIPIGVYYLIYKPTQYFLMGTGYMFDIMLNLSIRKEFVSDPPFIDKSWKVIRDFSNMAFIFVLLYTGIATMLGTPGWAKTVRNVIIIALLINFSLFFTKVVIDAGNILAVGVYESIKAGNPSLSEEISKGFKPQGFLGATNVSDAMDAIIVFLLAAVVSGYAGYIFFKASLLFLGRLIAFWFLMIVSPFAFISITLPKGNVFSQWWGLLLNQAFVAPVFLFLLYLIMQIANAGIFDGSQMTGSWLFDKLLTPILMGTLILMAMQKALALSEKMAGDFGKLGASMVTKSMGLTAAGVAMTGGAGVRALSAIGGKFGGRGGVLGAIGDASARVGHAGRNMTFDARNIPIPLAGGTVGSHTGAGTGRTATFAQTRAEAVKKDAERAAREAEKPESVVQARKNAEDARKKTGQRKADQIASLTSTSAIGVPGAPGYKPATVGLRDELTKLQADHAALEAKNASPGPLRLPLKDQFEADKHTFETAELALQGDPSNPALQGRLIMTRNNMRTSEKELKDFRENPEKIEKLKDKIEKYEAL